MVSSRMESGRKGTALIFCLPCLPCLPGLYAPAVPRDGASRRLLASVPLEHGGSERDGSSTCPSDGDDARRRYDECCTMLEVCSTLGKRGRVLAARTRCATYDLSGRTLWFHDSLTMCQKRSHIGVLHCLTKEEAIVEMAGRGVSRPRTMIGCLRSRRVSSHRVRR